MPTAFTGQNGATLKQSTPVSVTGCSKHKAEAEKKSKTGKGNAWQARQEEMMVALTRTRRIIRGAEGDALTGTGK